MSDRCDGRCVTPEDLGVMGAGVEVAYPDPECSLHGKVHDRDPDSGAGAA